MRPRYFAEWLGTVVIVFAVALAFASIAQSLAACKSAPAPAKQLATTAIDCAKAEAEAIAANQSVLRIAQQVNATINAAKAGLTELEGQIEQLIGKYGEPIIACAIERELAPVAATGALARVDMSTPDSLRQRLVVLHQWTFGGKP